MSLPANIRIVLLKKNLSLFVRGISDEEKKSFMTSTPGVDGPVAREGDLVVGQLIQPADVELKFNELMSMINNFSCIAIKQV